jgi:hypothetical protein
MIDLHEMTGSPEETFSHEIISPVPIDFESYRQLCDSIDEFRKVGVQDEDSYGEILRDERTVFVDYKGQRIPLLAPLEYEKMYNKERSCELSGKSKAMLLAIPLERLRQMELEDQLTIDEDTLVIVEEFVPTDSSLVLDQHGTTGLPFTNARPIDFKNPALSTIPPNETAWMAAYRFYAEPKEGPVREYEGEPLADQIMEKWHEYRTELQQSEFPDEHSTGTFFLSAEQLAQRPDIVEQLWDISQIGFGKILGEGHPVSMEFNREFFYKEIASKKAITAVYCVEGKIECFSFVRVGLEDEETNEDDDKDGEWLNDQSSVLRDMVEEAKMNSRAFAHVHELIGRGQKGMGYGRKILNTFFDVVARTEYSYSVFFESTNMSSLYIPPLIVRSLEKSEAMTMTSDIKTLGKLSYWGLVA